MVPVSLSWLIQRFLETPGLNLTMYLPVVGPENRSTDSSEGGAARAMGAANNTARVAKTVENRMVARRRAEVRRVRERGGENTQKLVKCEESLARILSELLYLSLWPHSKSV